MWRVQFPKASSEIPLLEFKPLDPDAELFLTFTMGSLHGRAAVTGDLVKLIDPGAHANTAIEYDVFPDYSCLKIFTENSGKTAEEFSPTGREAEYCVRGTVAAVDRFGGGLTVCAAEILMPIDPKRMPAEMTRLTVGQRVSFLVERLILWI
jgi:hypothetical protein